MDEELETLARWVREAGRIAFFGGAGVSTESGLPDFRSAGGLYQAEFGGVTPEEILSHGYFMRKPEAFYAFYRSKMLYPDAMPNAAHKKLAQWEAQGCDVTVITQNIDGLHQAAGSKNVVELHGSALRNACMRCGRRYGLDKILEGDGVPRCACGGMIKPDVVLYGEMLDEQAIEQAVEAISRAELLIVAGTSLTVYPAAGLVALYHGSHLALINRAPTPMDERANLILRGDAGATMAALP